MTGAQNGSDATSSRSQMPHSSSNGHYDGGEDSIVMGMVTTLFTRMHKLEQEVKGIRPAFADLRQGCEANTKTIQLLDERFDSVKDRLRIVEDKLDKASADIERQSHGREKDVQGCLGEVKDRLSCQETALKTLTIKYEQDLSAYGNELIMLRMGQGDVDEDVKAPGWESASVKTAASSDRAPAVTADKGDRVAKAEVFDDCSRQLEALRDELADIKTAQTELRHTFKTHETCTLAELGQLEKRVESIAAVSVALGLGDKASAKACTVVDVDSKKARDNAEDTPQPTRPSSRNSMLSDRPLADLLNVRLEPFYPEGTETGQEEQAAIRIAGAASTTTGADELTEKHLYEIFTDNCAQRLASPTDGIRTPSPCAETTEGESTAHSENTESIVQQAYQRSPKPLSTRLGDAKSSTTLDKRLSKGLLNLSASQLFPQRHSAVHLRSFIWINLYFASLEQNWRGFRANIIEAHDDKQPLTFPGNRMKSWFYRRVTNATQYGLDIRERSAQATQVAHTVFSVDVRISAGRGEPIVKYGYMAFAVLPDREMASDVEIVRREHKHDDPEANLAFEHVLDANLEPRIRLFQHPRQPLIPLQGRLHPRVAEQHRDACYQSEHGHGGDRECGIRTRRERSEGGSTRPAKQARLQ